MHNQLNKQGNIMEALLTHHSLVVGFKNKDGEMVNIDLPLECFKERIEELVQRLPLQ